MSSRRTQYTDFAVFDLHDVLALAVHALTAPTAQDQALVLMPGQPMTLTSACPAKGAPPPVSGYSPHTDRRLDLPAPTRLALHHPTDPLDSLITMLYRALAAGEHWLYLVHPWDDTDTSLECDTASSLPAHLQPADAKHIPATVSIDDFGPFPALIVKGYTWNGWTLPSFDLDTVRAIADAVHAQPADEDQRTRIDIDDDGTVTLLMHVGTEDEDRTVLHPDGDGRYRVVVVVVVVVLVDRLHAHIAGPAATGRPAVVPVA